MSNGLKTIIISVAAIITIATISFLFLTTNTGKDFVNETVPKLFDHSDKDSSGVYEAYNGTTVLGKDVLAAVEKYSDSVEIRITLGDGTKVDDLSLIKDKNSSFWINPTGTFSASLLFDDEDKNVIAILFNQVVTKVSKPTVAPAPPSTNAVVEERASLVRVTATDPKMYTFEGASEVNRYGMTLTAYFANGEKLQLGYRDIIQAGNYKGTYYNKGDYYDNVHLFWDATKHVVKDGEEDSVYSIKVGFSMNDSTVYCTVNITVTTPLEYTLTCVCDGSNSCGVCTSNSILAGHPLKISTNKKIGVGSGVTVTIKDNSDANPVSSDLDSNDNSYTFKSTNNSAATYSIKLYRDITFETLEFSVDIIKYVCNEKKNSTSNGAIGTSSHLVASGDDVTLSFNANSTYTYSNCTEKSKTAKSCTVTSGNGSDSSTINLSVTAKDPVSGFTIPITIRVYSPLSVNQAEYDLIYDTSNKTKSTGANSKRVQYSSSDTSIFTVASSSTITAGQSTNITAAKTTGYGTANLVLKFVDFGDRTLNSKVYVYKSLSGTIAGSNSKNAKTYGLDWILTATPVGGYGTIQYSWSGADIAKTEGQSLLATRNPFILQVNAAETSNKHTIDKLTTSLANKVWICTLTDGRGNTYEIKYNLQTPSASFDVKLVTYTYSNSTNPTTVDGSSSTITGHPVKPSLVYKNEGSGGTFSYSVSGVSCKYGSTNTTTSSYSTNTAYRTWGSYFTSNGRVVTSSNTNKATVSVSRSDTGEVYSAGMSFVDVSPVIYGPRDGAATSGELNALSATENVQAKANTYMSYSIYSWSKHPTVTFNSDHTVNSVSSVTASASGTITDSSSKSTIYSPPDNSCWFYVGDKYKTDTYSSKGEYRVGKINSTIHSSKDDFVYSEVLGISKSASGDATITCGERMGATIAIFKDEVSGWKICRARPTRTPYVFVAYNFANTDGNFTFGKTQSIILGGNQGFCIVGDADEASSQNGKHISSEVFKGSGTTYRFRLLTNLGDYEMSVVSPAKTIGKHHCGSGNMEISNYTHPTYATYSGGTITGTLDSDSSFKAYTFIATPGNSSSATVDPAKKFAYDKRCESSKDSGTFNYANVYRVKIVCKDICDFTGYLSFRCTE